MRAYDDEMDMWDLRDEAMEQDGEDYMRSLEDPEDDEEDMDEDEDDDEINN